MTVAGSSKEQRGRLEASNRLLNQPGVTEKGCLQPASGYLVLFQVHRRLLSLATSPTCSTRPLRSERAHQRA